MRVRGVAPGLSVSSVDNDGANIARPRVQQAVGRATSSAQIPCLVTFCSGT